MGYMTNEGRWANTVDELVLAALAERNDAEATGEPIELGDRGTLRAVLTVTAKAGTSPTLDVTIETSRDGATWYEAGSFDQVSDPNLTSGPLVVRKIVAIDRFVRVKWEVGGSADPALTFSLEAEAV